MGLVMLGIGSESIDEGIPHTIEVILGFIVVMVPNKPGRTDDDWW